jgi:hypothetical protein
MTLLLATLLAAVAGAAQWDMTTIDEVQVIGIETRTSNAKEMTAEGVIGKQWARLTKEGLLARIPNKLDSAIVALYTDYESDKDGAYTFVLGARVSSAARVPEGMVMRKIPAGMPCSRRSAARRRGWSSRPGSASGLPRSIAPTRPILKCMTSARPIRQTRR